MEILASGFRHGITEADILHVLRMALVVEEIAEDPVRYLVLGTYQTGNFLELVVMDRPDGPAVIHAMRMRDKYRNLLPRGE